MLAHNTVFVSGYCSKSKRVCILCNLIEECMAHPRARPALQNNGIRQSWHLSGTTLRDEYGVDENMTTGPRRGNVKYMLPLVALKKVVDTSLGNYRYTFWWRVHVYVGIVISCRVCYSMEHCAQPRPQLNIHAWQDWAQINER